MSHSNLLIFAISAFFFVGCGTTRTTNEQSFECQLFFLPKDINWEFAYDNVKFSTSPIIIQDGTTNWAVLFPGSITLDNDTISVNQEAGYPNTCLLIGNLELGDSTRIQLNSPENSFSFALTSDSTPYFQGIEYAETEYQITRNCWCDWK